MDGSSVARYTVNTTREVFIFGDEHYISMLQAQARAYYFLNPRHGNEYGGFRSEMHFVVGVVDFNDPQKLQRVTRKFSELTSPHVHKVIYAVGPDTLLQEHLLLSKEIGSRYVFAGNTKNDDFKEYLKRTCIESSQTGSVTELEEEFMRARMATNKQQMLKVVEKVKSLPRESEESHRLLAIAYSELLDFKRSESYLRRLLQSNPQNLWAANTLAKQYLRSGRAAEGIEIMHKLSAFHELNSDRLLTFGRALLIVGDNKGAQAQFEKGASLVGGQGGHGGQDGRFADGLALVKVAQGDAKGAASLFGTKSLSSEVMSFLNLKAIMSSKQRRYPESIRYYEFAVSGAGGNNEILAKLKFNMALTYVRMNDLAKAKLFFSSSLELGGKKFQRAKRPLEIVNLVIQQKTSLNEASRQEIFGEGEEEEWETLF